MSAFGYYLIGVFAGIISFVFAMWVAIKFFSTPGPV